MDSLVADRFIVVGGPVGRGDFVAHLVEAADEQERRNRLAEDPWAIDAHLTVESVEPWSLWLDGRHTRSSTNDDAGGARNQWRIPLRDSVHVLLTRADRDVPDVRDVLAADQRGRAALRRAPSWPRASARAVRGRSYRCGMQTDFDFYVGVWDVQNRRLVKRLAGSDEWETFPARSVARAVFDGAANLDEISFPTKGWSGLTLRLYDSDSDEWALYWVSDAASRIEPPVVGRWNDRREFVGYCDDTFEGRPVLVRFIWSGISETTAHWEQAFSIDAGQTWETNWVMDSTRVS